MPAPDRPFRPRFSGFENLCLYLVAGQFAVFAMGWFRPAVDGLNPVIGLLLLDPALVFQGEVWRLFTFVLLPPFWPGQGDILGVVFLAFAWYIFYIMGTALESTWGTRRLNLFLLLWWVFALLSTFFAALVLGQPAGIADTYPLKISVFIAFAFLYPNFTLMLFFVLPVKVIWLAVFALVLLGFQFLGGSLSVKLAVAATLGNVAVFFGPRAWFLWRQRQRRAAFKEGRAATGSRPRKRKAVEGAAEGESFHRCDACGKTDQTHPEKDFRYVKDPQSDESRCYCLHYIKTGEKCAD
jgi:hypothetical protein